MSALPPMPTPLEFRLANADPTDHAALLRVWRDAGALVRAFEEAAPLRAVIRAECEVQRREDYVAYGLDLAKRCGRFDITRDDLEARYAVRHDPVLHKQVNRVTGEHESAVAQVEQVVEFFGDTRRIAVVNRPGFDGGSPGWFPHAASA